MGDVTVTKVGHHHGEKYEHTFRAPLAPSRVTVSPIGKSPGTSSRKSFSLSSYLERRVGGGGRGRSFADVGTWGAPSVEIIGEVGEQGEEELPAGTRIITHPLKAGRHGTSSINLIAQKLHEEKSVSSRGGSPVQGFLAPSRQMETVEQLARVERLEQELGREQDRLRAMLNHLTTSTTGPRQMGENWPGPGGGERFPQQGQERGGRHNESDIRSELETNRQLYQNKDVRPPFTYAALIKQALANAPGQQMSLNDIYTWFTDSFAFYRNNPHSWKNAVRHNLSLHNMFQKVEAAHGSVWRLV